MFMPYQCIVAKKMCCGFAYTWQFFDWSVWRAPKQTNIHQSAQTCSALLLGLHEQRNRRGRRHMKEGDVRVQTLFSSKVAGAVRAEEWLDACVRV